MRGPPCDRNSSTPCCAATRRPRSDFGRTTSPTNRFPARAAGRSLLGFDDEPVAIVETTEVRVARAGDVDLAFAVDEGEGFETVADWRRAHENFWSDRQIDDDTLIVAERFILVERL